MREMEGARARTRFHSDQGCVARAVARSAIALRWKKWKAATTREIAVMERAMPRTPTMGRRRPTTKGHETAPMVQEKFRKLTAAATFFDGRSVPRRLVAGLTRP